MMPFSDVPRRTRVCLAWVRPHSLLVALAVLAASGTLPASGNPTIAQITRTWTGIEDPASGQPRREFTLELREIQSAAMTDQELRGQALFELLAPSAPRAPNGVPVNGTWTSVILMRQGLPAATVKATTWVETVSGHYVPDTGILTLNVASNGQRPPGRINIVFDAAGQRWAGMRAFGTKAFMPLYAIAGDKMTPELVAAATGATVSGGAPRSGGSRAMSESPMGQLEAHRQAVMAEMPPVDSLSRAEAEAALKELKEQVAEAQKSGDMRRMSWIAARQLALQRHMLRLSAPVGVPRPAKPDPILRWIAQMEHGGLSLEFGDEMVMVANLFQPRHFVSYFGKTFLEMGTSERQRVAATLNGLRGRADVPLARGPYFMALVGAFQAPGRQPSGFDAVDAGVGGLALALIAEWNERMMSALAQTLDVRAIESFTAQRAQVTLGLWPGEVEAGRRYTLDVYSHAHLKAALARIDTLVAGAPADSILNELALLPSQPEFTHLDANDHRQFDARYETALDSAVEAFVDAARATWIDTPPSIALLRQGAAWFEKHRPAIQALAGRERMRAFLLQWIQTRARTVDICNAAIIEELKALSSTQQVARYFQGLVIAIDDRKADSWVALTVRVNAVGNELDRAAFVARVGEGPFDPEFPGAIYLNAIYRNDREQIRREDRAFVSWHEKNMHPVVESGLLELVQVLSGGGVTAAGMRAGISREFERASLVRVVAALFILNYEHAYPDCLGANPAQFTLTEEWRDEYGRLAPGYPQSKTTFNVARRHADAFRILEAYDPRETLFAEALRRDDGSIRISEIVKGIDLAMERYPCDHPVMQQFEQNMLALFNESIRR